MIVVRKMFLLAIVCTFSACISDSNSSSDPDSNSNPGQGSTDELQGSWSTECFLAPNSSGDIYYKNEVTFSDGEATYKWSDYLDEDCSVLDYSFMERSTYTIGKELELEDATKVFEIDYTSLRHSILTTDEDLQDGFSSSSFCGISNWDLNDWYDVTNCEELEMPATIVDIYMVDGDKLFVGDFEGYESIESYEVRPSKLYEEVYTKQ